MKHEIYIIDDKNELTQGINKAFEKEKDYAIKTIKTKELEDVLNNIPSLIIINEENSKKDIIEVCNEIRENEDNSITPIIVISESEDINHKIEILQSQVEFIIKKPVDREYLYYTIKNITRLMGKNRGVSPLTGLPGNIQIQAELKKKMLKKEEFIVMYFDLDNFKAYNDTYGFVAGDEIIKQTAKIIIENINKEDSVHNFIGHIGGDDFVAILRDIDYETICQDIILEFDDVIQNYYTEEDKNRGYLKVPNRRGIIEEIPLVSISIGIVEVSSDRFNNPLEIGEVGAQVKHLAKVTQGSAYAINRRKH